MLVGDILIIPPYVVENPLCTVIRNVHSIYSRRGTASADRAVVSTLSALQSSPMQSRP